MKTKPYRVLTNDGKITKTATKSGALRIAGRLARECKDFVTVQEESGGEYKDIKYVQPA